MTHHVEIAISDTQQHRKYHFDCAFEDSRLI
jgi:hypothetical protein